MNPILIALVAAGGVYLLTRGAIMTAPPPAPAAGPGEALGTMPVPGGVPGAAPPQGDLGGVTVDPTIVADQHVQGGASISTPAAPAPPPPRLHVKYVDRRTPPPPTPQPPRYQPIGDPRRHRDGEREAVKTVCLTSPCYYPAQPVSGAKYADPRLTSETLIRSKRMTGMVL